MTSSVVPPPAPPASISTITANDIDWTMVSEMSPSLGLQFLLSSFGSSKHKVKMYEAVYELEYLNSKLKFIEQLADKPDIQVLFYNNLRLEGFVLP
jgi:hypothetical protein